jgi:hypothetical protein
MGPAARRDGLDLIAAVASPVLMRRAITINLYRASIRAVLPGRLSGCREND